jgi:hypothetical protein
MKNGIIKVPFYGNEIVVIEKNGERLVAMKPIAEALGLEWSGQLKLIKNDLVLHKGMVVTSIPSEGGVQDTVCLPLEYLNGWLFKVPASRYTGKKRETIIRYQEECYSALYEYFHNGGAVNRNINQNQLADLLQAVASTTAHAVSETMGNKILEIAQQVKNFEKVVIDLQKENALLKEFSPQGYPGEISRVTGLPRDRYVRGYYTSNRSGTPIANLYLQLELPLGI